MYDVIIIGGGPAGLSCAIYCKRAGLNVCILDKCKKSHLLIKASFLKLYKETYIPHRALNAKFKLHNKRVPGEHFPRWKGQVKTLIESPTMYFL